MEIFSHTFAAGLFPGNKKIPFLIYKDAFDLDSDQLMALFQSNGWKNCWVDSIYPFDHFHSNTHEALGITKGSARVLIGGDKGKIFEIGKGDLLLIPAGVSHKKLSASDDFEVVGCYPFDIQYDMHKEGAHHDLIEKIDKVPLPKSDPIFGKKGPLFEYWHD